jgi:hypothetical protein
VRLPIHISMNSQSCESIENCMDVGGKVYTRYSVENKKKVSEVCKTMLGVLYCKENMVHESQGNNEKCLQISVAPLSIRSSFVPCLIFTTESRYFEAFSTQNKKETLRAIFVMIRFFLFPSINVYSFCNMLAEGIHIDNYVHSLSYCR